MGRDDDIEEKMIRYVFELGKQKPKRKKHI